MRDLRKFARQTNIRLVAGGILLAFTVGLGLIYFFYGPRSAALGLVCLLAAMVPVVLVILILWGMEAVVKKANRDAE